MTVWFIDVSHHDWNRRGGNLDWAAVRAAVGSPVTCIRATYGDPAGWSRPTYHHLDMARAAAAAGFTHRGSYHNLIKGDAASVARQVDWLRREMDAAGSVWGMADVEAYEELQIAGLVQDWSTVLRWRDRWAQVEQRPMVWYLAGWVWRQWLGSPDLRQLPGLLINARYPTTVDGTVQQIYAAAGGDAGPGWAEYRWTAADGTVHRAGRAPDLWQFTSAANVPGATDNTDANAYRGTLTQLLTTLHPTGTTRPASGGDPMFLARLRGTDAVVLSNGITCRWVTANEFAQVQNLGPALGLVDTTIREVDHLETLGVLVGPRHEATFGPDPLIAAVAQATATELTRLPIDVTANLSTEDAQAIATAVVDALPGVTLSAEQVAGIADAVLARLGRVRLAVATDQP